MNEKEFLSATAAHFGIDVRELMLAAKAAAAGKEVAERTMSASPDELKRMRDMKRLWELRLDLYQREKEADKLPDVFENEAQLSLATTLNGTSHHIRKLEHRLLGPKRVSPRSDIVKRAHRLAMAHYKITR